MIADRDAAIAVRTVDLSRPLEALTDVAGYRQVYVVVLRDGRLLGRVQIKNARTAVSATHLRDAVVSGLSIKLMKAILERGLEPGERTASPAPLPADVAVSIVLATRDRPDDLRRCLQCLTAQVTPRRVEIIVVDNHPASRLTSPIVAEFPSVTLVTEERQGLSYARNAGILASQGAVVIATDDDVTMPPDWLERLLAPFVQPDVMVVTGNVLPETLDTVPQQLFELYGGLGRGFEPLRADRHWFRRFRTAVPTWNLGGTANAAFRATIFDHPDIGLLDEALGAGTPTGCSEDTYVFYKVLKAGYAIVYEPTAYVWHRHRRDVDALRRQLFAYSTGHVAYHLTTLIRDRDLRALWRLVYRLPLSYVWRIRGRLRGSNPYPLWLLLTEMAGNLLGPWALVQARRRVRRLGSSRART